MDFSEGVKIPTNYTELAEMLQEMMDEEIIQAYKKMDGFIPEEFILGTSLTQEDIVDALGFELEFRKIKSPKIRSAGSAVA